MDKDTILMFSVVFFLYSGFVSGHFDTSGSVIALFVAEISPSVFFVTSTEELGILVGGLEI